MRLKIAKYFGNIFRKDSKTGTDTDVDKNKIPRYLIQENTILFKNFATKLPSS